MGSVVLGRFRCVILISDLTFRESHLWTHEIVALMDARLCTIQLILCNIVTRASQLSLRFFINLNIFMCGMLRFLVSGDHGMWDVVIGWDRSSSLSYVRRALREHLTLSGAFWQSAASERAIVDATEVNGATASTSFSAVVNSLEVAIPRRADTSTWLVIRVNKYATIAWQSQSCVIQCWCNRLDWVIDKWLANVLVVKLVFFRDIKRFL